MKGFRLSVSSFAACCLREMDGGTRGLGLRLDDGGAAAARQVAPKRDARNLGEEQSPWKERALRCWQRRHSATDSLTEQSLVAGCSASCSDELGTHRSGGGSSPARAAAGFGWWHSPASLSGVAVSRPRV